ncbi:MAG: cytochrome b [Burkholderiaceae bacterium]
MGATNQVQRYTKTAMVLHWLMALAIISGWVMGNYMVDLKFSPDKLQLYSWHKWIGFTVFMLALLRLVWRWTHKPPPPLPGQPAWQLHAASITHALFYALFLAVPISGWLFSSSTGFPLVYLGLLPIPDLIGKSPELKDTLKAVHWYLSTGLAALVVLHIGAAIKHTVVSRDTTLARMLPWGRPDAHSQR